MLVLSYLVCSFKYPIFILIFSVGKTTTTEFTLLNAGPETTNPHDPNRTPGGSSAGSAAAVADFQVPVSFGTQNGGSVVRPAFYTGIFAMKPTFNAISAEGIKMVSFSIDTCGFFARSVEDLQLVADVFAIGKIDPLPTVSLKEARVAFIKTALWPMAGPGTISAMEKAAEILQRHRVRVEELDLPSEFSDVQTLRGTHKTILSVEAQTALLIQPCSWNIEWTS